ncbi:MAG TPA: hypothetical protein VD962_12025, partial [Rubricoccaceae bacterium]|nr:hypothetical protein [Rubricoccaceae bacterium]
MPARSFTAMALSHLRSRRFVALLVALSLVLSAGAAHAAACAPDEAEHECCCPPGVHPEREACPVHPAPVEDRSDLAPAS